MPAAAGGRSHPGRQAATWSIRRLLAAVFGGAGSASEAVPGSLIDSSIKFTIFAAMTNPIRHAVRQGGGRRPVEQARREAVIAATIAAIDDVGSLDVTVADIAARAGISPALIHHYFGSKDDVLIAAMRQLLRQYRGEVAQRLAAAEGPRQRVSAVVAGSFASSQFSGESVSAWLVFYLYARRSGEAARLLRIYFRRLETNLVSALRPLVGMPRAGRIAAAAGAMIDGVWLRQALTPLTQPDPQGAADMVERFIDAELKQ